ncbi:MAG: hypothetical protein J3K34DRAFT_433963 [Monoraphidium minutum]|nr:MAG: hypothetical protein J3K34DRAFT_433963 [Monoraphidium minutum]
MGPAWHGVYLTPDSLALQGRVAKECGYMHSLSVHYYCWDCATAIRERGAGIAGLLDEAEAQEAAAQLRRLVAAAKSEGLPLRITEANSISGGGMRWYSESYGAALWTADFAFDAAAAGVSGLHYHWGVGGTLGGGGPAYTGVQTNFRAATGKPYPSVHAPWYGYLLFTHATQGPGVRFVRHEARRAASPSAPSNCSAQIKVFALTGGDVPSMGQAGASLRLVAINKDLRRACAVTFSVGGRWGDGLAVYLLPGARGMMSKGGITWKSQWYEGTSDGRIAGRPMMQPLPPLNVARGAQGGVGGAAWRTEFTLARLGPGHAAVVTALAA